MFSFDHFSTTLEKLGATQDVETFELLAALYSEASRFYHDQSHVSECLRQFQKLQAQAERPHEIEMAIWFHDAIYDTQASDNEEKSADLAVERLSIIHVATASIERIADMIIATKTHQPTSADCKLMVDVDLGILGAANEAFEQYDQDIRREYHWVPEEVYVPGRAKVLKSFLERDIIYHTPQLRNTFEESARTNLARKIQELEAGT